LSVQKAKMRIGRPTQSPQREPQARMSQQGSRYLEKRKKYMRMIGLTLTQKSKVELSFAIKSISERTFALIVRETTL
jgi:hypothetical protein